MRDKQGRKKKKKKSLEKIEKASEVFLCKG
jgi:hypothetical protein